MIGILILRVAIMSLDPSPRDPMASFTDGGDRLMPEFEIFDRSRLSFPSARRPAEHPFRQSIDEVARIAGKYDTSRFFQRPKRLDHGSQRHSIVRRRTLGHPDIALL